MNIFLRYEILWMKKQVAKVRLKIYERNAMRKSTAANFLRTYSIEENSQSLKAALFECNSFVREKINTKKNYEYTIVK